IRENVFRLGDTSYERIPITLAAVKVIQKNPLGVGYSYPEHVAEIYSEIEHYPGALLALVQFPHSIVFGIAVILGIPALLLVILFYFLLFRGLWRVHLSKDSSLQILAIGLGGSFVAY